MNNIFKLALLMAFCAAAPARATELQAMAINDPVFNELTADLSEEIDPNSPEARDNTAEMLQDMNKAVNSEPSVTGEPLAEVGLNTQKNSVENVYIQPTVKRFMLIESDYALADKISADMGEENIAVSGLNFKRVGGTKMFGFEQVKKVIIKSRFAIERIDIDKDSGEFTSVIKPQVGAYEIEVSGKFSASVKIPVIAKTIPRGTTITQNDIELKNYPKEKLTEDSIVDVSELVGKAATKALTKGTAISKNDVKAPVSVRKNTTVSAVYRSDTIEVKALAIAQEDGSPGDLISLKNYDSGKLFKAMVQEDGTVAIELGNNNLSLNYNSEQNIN